MKPLSRSWLSVLADLSIEFAAVLLIAAFFDAVYIRELNVDIVRLTSKLIFGILLLVVAKTLREKQ